MSMPEILPPEILTAAGSAWDKAHERQETASQGFGSAALFGALDGAVSEAREKDGVGFGLGDVVNPKIREQFKQYLKSYEKIFAGADIKMPTSDELARGGIDFGYLAELKEELPGYDLVVAPLTLSLDTLCQLVSTVQRDETIDKNPLEVSYSMFGKRREGLRISDSATDDWDQAMASTTESWLLPTAKDEYEWTAFLLPNNEDTLEYSPDYVEVAKEDRLTIPVSSYIAYQLYRIHLGILPLESKRPSAYSLSLASSGEFTDSTIYRNTCVLIAGWDSDSGEIYVDTISKKTICINVRMCVPIG